MSYEPPAGIATAAAAEGDRVDQFLPSMFNEIEELGSTRSRPGLVPFGIVRTDDPNTHNTFVQLMRVWIAPEIARRQGSRPDRGFEVREAVIVFPPRDAPERHRVLLNDEVRVQATLAPSYHDTFASTQSGDTVGISLGDMFDLRHAVLDGVDMGTDGFAWIRPENGRWSMYFNFLPTSGFDSALVKDELEHLMSSVQDAIAQEMLRTFLRDIFVDDEAVRIGMASDGWCLTPILIPGAWRRMCDAYRNGDSKNAEAVAIEAVGHAQLDRMLTSWITEEPFASDESFLKTGIERYKAGDYISSVSVLLPRIEGLTNRVREKCGIGAEDSISKVFRSLDKLASAEIRDGFLAMRIREEFELLITNFLLIHFQASSQDAANVRGRHAHAHGATIGPHYNQAYALKIILALDALYFVAR